MKKTTRNAIDYMMAALLIIFSVWLLIQPISAYADSIENVEATKAPKGTHGWIYNKKTKVLQFCMQITGQPYDAMAEVLCIPYPKKVKPIDDYESFFLDDNMGTYLPAEK
ncbi:MAG: hypothetical protein HOG97_05240 [Candidatus Marinimicrobia bacterium]|jgi:hypothetical protein|nr:hypothetical protein [Candidatus Neomarinimicrobiota bacterium]